MATVSPPMNTPVRSIGLRERFRMTRLTIFALFFILVGAVILLTVPGSTDSTVRTTLTLGETTLLGIYETRHQMQIVVPTAAYAAFVGLVLYLAGGLFSLIPDERLDRAKFWWLFLNGLLIIPTVLIIAAAGKSTNATVMLQTSFRLATPIVIGALAGIWSERSGVVNIAIEGMMLTGAAFGFVAFTLMLKGDVGLSTQHVLYFSVLVATIAGGVMALLHAWLSITFKTDQIVSGTVINIMAIGLTSFVRREVLLSSEAGRETLQQIRIPVLADVPIVGEIFFNAKPIFYSMLILVVVTHIILFYTRWGLRTRAVGENPHAADTLGINVIRNRWVNVFISGLIAGLGGAWFSLETTGNFDDNMTSGRGFIGLAAMIFGKYLPFGAMGGGLLFGFSDALGQRFQILDVNIPSQFLQMTPFVVTMIVLAGLVGRATPPKADGIPYEKE